MFNLYNEDKVMGLISNEDKVMGCYGFILEHFFFDIPDLACVIVHTYSHMYGRLSKIP